MTDVCNTGPVSGVISLAFERLPGVELFQIVHTAPTILSIRLQPTPGADPQRVWQIVHAEITRLLGDH
jgi:phenylacetate-CoA ligase